jgi:hypothetical protein
MKILWSLLAFSSLHSLAETPSDLCGKEARPFFYQGTNMESQGKPLFFVAQVSADHLRPLVSKAEESCSLTAFLLNASSPYATKHATRRFTASRELCGRLARSNGGFFKLDVRDFHHVCDAKEISGDQKQDSLGKKSPREIVKTIFPDLLPKFSDRLAGFVKEKISEASLAELHLPFGTYDPDRGKAALRIYFEDGLVPADVMEKTLQSYGLGGVEDREAGELLARLGLAVGKPAKFVDLSSGQLLSFRSREVMLFAGPTECTEPFNRPAVTVRLESLAGVKAKRAKPTARSDRMLLLLPPGFSVVESKDSELRQKVIQSVKEDLMHEPVDLTGKLLELQTPAGSVYLFPSAYSESRRAVFVFEKSKGKVIRHSKPIASFPDCV